MKTSLKEFYEKDPVGCKKAIAKRPTGYLLEELDDVVQIDLCREPNLLDWETKSEYALYQTLFRELKRRVPQRNIAYDLAVEEYDEMTLDDFVRVCTELDFPVFERVSELDLTANSDEENREFKTNVYKNMSEYKIPEHTTMQADAAERIKIGLFDVIFSEGNRHYETNFHVLQGCVVIHTIVRIH